MEFLGSRPLHEGRHVDFVRLPLAEIERALPEIRDAATVIALLWLQRRLD